MIRCLSFAALVALAVPAGAQIGRAPRGGSPDPGYWVGLSYGYMDGLTLNDGHSNSTWRFNYTSQIRATFEKTMSRNLTIGASAGFSNPRLAYTGRAIGDPCGPGCEADAEVTQYLAFIRSGGGVGFHGLFNLEAGVTQFANFHGRTSGSDLSQVGTARDFTFGLGGGFGFGFSPTTEIYIAEQVDLVMHPQGDEPGTESTSAPRSSAFRLGARIGF